MVYIKQKNILKIIVDIAMTATLLLLMTYELIGQEMHEWLGVGMFMMFVLHHILNWKWSQNLLKGKYTVFRVAQTVLIVLVLFSMMGSMISGIILSKHVLSFLPIKGGRSFARNLHMLSGYWGFVLMSLHLGFHWSMIVGISRKLVKKPSEIWSWTIRGIVVLIAGYGVYAFIRRDIGSYMLLKNQFVFFDFEEPLVRFLLDYLAAMGLFVWIGHYLSKALKKLHKRKPVA